MKNNGKQQWIVGKVVIESLDENGDFRWSFVGVFDEKQKAVAACMDADYFLAPTVLNKASKGKDTIKWKGVWYPVAEPDLTEADLAILDE